MRHPRPDQLRQSAERLSQSGCVREFQDTAVNGHRDKTAHLPKRTRGIKGVNERMVEIGKGFGLEFITRLRKGWFGQTPDVGEMLFHKFLQLDRRPAVDSI